MEDTIGKRLKEALELSKVIQLKLKYMNTSWAGWVRKIDQSGEDTYYICEFERLLNPEAFKSNPNFKDTIPQRLPSFWIEDVQAI